MNHIPLELLGQYIGGTLSGKQREEVEAHLSVCERCREEFVMAADLIDDESLYEPSDIPGVCLPVIIRKARFTVQTRKARSADLIDDESLHEPSDMPEGCLPGIIRKARFTVLTRKVRSAVSGIAKRFRGAVCEWQQGMAPPAWTLQSVRSESLSPESAAEQTYFLRKRMRNIDIELYAEQSDENHMRLCVKAFKREKPLCNVEVGLQREGGGKSMKILRHETAFFEKKRLPFGIYHLSLRYEEKPLGTYTFQIDPTGIYEEKDPLS
ncbi:hypothetical protein DENIS_0285 [Desulfonema ishimotonii]|uniref:Putative zinc-finger domain-containing protein n=1 Tax=Desulfonema ishimotonii TaxID=45657 RepID=A0A401FQV6_9BACT|nr:zf-HC2 domain-containing protein [Desulfonema ishimotonii]GBC59346.1 hypothetical protein DENIS_0285 [Desulfonema ishimotonii]